jgi:hypothetical protein
MKKSLYLLSISLLTLIMFIATPVSAQRHHRGGSPLPINSGVMFLMVAGAIIGIVAINKKAKLNKTTSQHN